MRNYGKIESGFWQNKKTRPLSDAGKLLLIYIYTCPHGNSVGCFVLPIGYISEDMGWLSERVTEHVTELVSKGFIEYDSDSKLVRIVGWFDHNTIENANVAKAAVASICKLPDCNSLSSLFIELLSSNNRFLNPFRNELRNSFPNSWPNPEPQPEPEPKPKPEPKSSGIRAHDPGQVEKPKKDLFEKNDVVAAAAACCEILGKRKLTLLDEEHLMAWCAKYDFGKQVFPLLIEGLEKFLRKSPDKRPSSLAYFAEKVREGAGGVA